MSLLWNTPLFRNCSKPTLLNSGSDYTTLYHPQIAKTHSNGNVSGVACSGKGFGSDLTSSPKPQKVKKSSKSNKSNKLKPISPSKSWEFEDMMIVWDEIFQKSCEKDIKRVKRIWQVAEDGYRVHGRGCVVLIDEILSVDENQIPSKSNQNLDLIKFDQDFNLPNCYSKKWTVKYLPRTWLLKLDEFTGRNSQDPIPSGEGQKPSSTDAKTVPLMTVDLLIPVLKSLGGDFSRLLTLTAEDPSQNESNSSQAEPESDSEPNEDLGSELPYNIENREVVFLLVVNFDDQKVGGADVIEPYFEMEDENFSYSRYLGGDEGSGSRLGVESDKLRYRVRGLDQYLDLVA